MIKKKFFLISVLCCFINFNGKGMKPAKPISTEEANLLEIIGIINQTKKTIEDYVGKMLAQQQDLEEELARANQQIAEKETEIKQNEEEIKKGVNQLKGESKVLATHFMWRYFILKTLRSTSPGYERNAALAKIMKEYKDDLDRLKAEPGMAKIVETNQKHYDSLAKLLGLKT
jgi:hypothetical protein